MGNVCCESSGVAFQRSQGGPRIAALLEPLEDAPSHSGEICNRRSAFSFFSKLATLPHGCPHGSSKNSHAEVRYGLVQPLRKDAVPVVDHEPIRMVARQRLPELLQGPLCSRVGGDVVVENSSCSKFHDHEYVKCAKSGRDHNEEVTRHDHLGMIVDKSQPTLLWIRSEE